MQCSAVKTYLVDTMTPVQENCGSSEVLDIRPTVEANEWFNCGSLMGKILSGTLEAAGGGCPCVHAVETRKMVIKKNNRALGFII